jgi:hypothetical protein
MSFLVIHSLCPIHVRVHVCVHVRVHSHVDGHVFVYVYVYVYMSVSLSVFVRKVLINVHVWIFPYLFQQTKLCKHSSDQSNGSIYFKSNLSSSGIWLLLATLLQKVLIPTPHPLLSPKAFYFLLCIKISSSCVFSRKQALHIIDFENVI